MTTAFRSRSAMPGPLDERGGIQHSVTYTAPPYVNICGIPALKVWGTNYEQGNANKRLTLGCYI